MSAVFHLKLIDPYFGQVQRGEKNFEVRRDDRGFQKGDVLILCRYSKQDSLVRREGYSDANGAVVSSYPTSPEVAKVRRRIAYILTGGQYGIEPGYVVLGLDTCGETDAHCEPMEGVV